MAFLLAGVALGATAVALSEADRDYYRTSRYTMDYLGNKNGLDIYKDRVSGYYYTDDGWDVKRVGQANWKPHPVDLQRLKEKLQQYSPQQVKFSAYILATFIGKEQQLWNSIFRKFELPKEPKKPHFGKTIRKQRWARYDAEFDEWQKKARTAKETFREENEMWNIRKREYQSRKNHASSGRDILSHALDNPSSGGLQKRTEIDTFKLVVPDDKKPGDTLNVQAGGRVVQVQIPPNGSPGTEVQFEIPKTDIISVPAHATVDANLPHSEGVIHDQSIPTAKAEPASSNPFDRPPPPATDFTVPPPAQGSTIPQPDYGAPPPAQGSGGIPPPAYGAPPPAQGSGGIPPPAYGAPPPAQGSGGIPPPAYGAPPPAQGATSNVYEGSIPPPAIQPQSSFKL